MTQPYIYRFPEMTEEQLSNGVRVIWLSDFEQPVLTVAVQVPGGHFSDPQDYEGTADLTVGLVQKGSSDCFGERFADRLEQAGTSLFSEVGDERICIGIRLLTKHSKDIVPRFWSMVTDPALDEGEFRHLKRELVTSLQAEQTDPGSLAHRHFYARLCGREHPAGRVQSLKSVKRISRQTVTDFARRVLVPANATIIVAGAFDVEEMRRRWEGLFSSWKAESNLPGPISADPLPSVGETRVHLVDKPDLSQATLILGHPSVSELDPDKSAIALGNYVLGGGNFSSRLMKRVRTETGHAYSVGSSIACYSRFGVFTASTSTQNAQVGTVIESILDVYREFSRNGASSEELEKAKQFMIGNLAFELEGIGNVAEKLLWLRFHKRGNEYIEQFAHRISGIDENAVRQAAKRHLSADSFLITVVGRKKELLSQLEAFGPVYATGFRKTP